MKPFFILQGTVVPGSGLGRRWGFPTANLSPDGEKIPPLGVYHVEAVWDGHAHAAVCNVGVRPTLDAGRQVWIEAHVLDFEGDLYGKSLRIDFLEKIRDEKRFASLEELSEQIRKDCAAVRSRAAGGSCRRSPRD